MAVGLLDHATVKLYPGQLIMKQEISMAIFHITNWNLDFKSDGVGGLQMFITMRRKLTSELMTTYFPTLLLTAIPFATTFFKPFFFEAALSVNLTTMLVMTTIFISKMDGLPPTSAIKMIDIWLIMCQLVPFCEVILLTAIEYNSGGEQGGKTKTINHHGEMRVVNLDDGSKEGNIGAAIEKPGSAWRPLEEGGNSLGCSTTWVLSLKSIRK